MRLYVGITEADIDKIMFCSLSKVLPDGSTLGDDDDDDNEQSDTRTSTHTYLYVYHKI